LISVLTKSGYPIPAKPMGSYARIALSDPRASVAKENMGMKLRRLDSAASL
jgi:hypothetical protein